MAGTEIMNQLLLDELMAKNNEALRVLVEEQGPIKETTNDVLTELHRISEDVVSEMSSVDEQTAKVYESWKTLGQRH